MNELLPEQHGSSKGIVMLLLLLVVLAIGIGWGMLESPPISPNPTAGAASAPIPSGDPPSAR